MSAYVVAGVTGHVGSVVAGDLLARGEAVRAIVRREDQAGAWQQKGAGAAVGSLADRQFLGGALAGARAFFTLLPPDYAAHDFLAAMRRVADAIAGAVRDSAVPHVVMLSSQGAELPAGTGPIRGLHYLENALRAAGTKLSAVRACYFQENIAEVIPVARQEGIYPNFMPSADLAVPMVATRDIGRLAARLMLSEPEASQAVDLLGPEYSNRRLCDKLGAALGKTLRLVDIPPAGHVPALMQAGLSRDIAEVMAELYAAMGSGLIAPKGDRLEKGATEIDEVITALTGQAQAGGTAARGAV